MELWVDNMDRERILDIEDVLVPCAKRAAKPSWWLNLAAWSTGENTIKNIFKRLSIKQMREHKPDIMPTAKVCPGFGNLFRRSVILKAPCEMLIETREDGSFDFRSSDDRLMKIEHHPPQQLAGFLKNDYIVLKFVTPLAITANQKTFGIYVDPIYFNKSDFIVPPGVAEYEKGKSAVACNCIVLAPKVNRKYTIEKGQVLAMITFDADITAIKHRGDESMKMKRTKFLGWSYNK